MSSPQSYPPNGDHPARIAWIKERVPIVYSTNNLANTSRAYTLEVFGDDVKNRAQTCNTKTSALEDYNKNLDFDDQDVGTEKARHFAAMINYESFHDWK